MTSKDPREPFDWYYYWNNQQEYPQAHSKQNCPNRDPYGKHMLEAKLLEFEKFNSAGHFRDYLNNSIDQNPSAAVYKNMWFKPEAIRIRSKPIDIYAKTGQNMNSNYKVYARNV